jgi:hypothetical protein
MMPTVRHAQALVIMLLAVAIAAAGSARAAGDTPAPALVIELNQLNQRNADCRLSLLIRNELGTRLADLELELVLFDKSKRIMKLLSVPAGAFPPRKTRIRQFDIANTACSSISSMLLNSITRCRGSQLTPEKCLERAKTRSATTTPLTY